MHGENKGRGPLFEYMCRIGLFFFFFKSETLFCLPSSFLISQPPMASQKLQYSWRSRCLLSFLPIPLRRQETPGVKCLCLPPSTQYTPPNWELSSWLALSGELPCHLSAGPYLFSHTQMHSRDHSFSQWMVCFHTFLPRLWTKSSFPRLDQPSWRRILGQRENECIGKKGQRSPERRTRDAYACAIISKYSNLYTKHATKHHLLQ